MMHFHIVTLFPESFTSYLQSSIIGRAIKRKEISITFYNPRDYTKDKYRRVDGRSYGGGPGMVIKAEPVARAVAKAVGRKKDVLVIFLCADGKQLSGKMAERYARRYRHVVLIAGHYEGIDTRVVKMVGAKKISIGQYILTGGELPAMVIIDSFSRFVPGVLGNEQSLESRRAASREVFTRPEKILYRGRAYKVPRVLLSGNHKLIERWRLKRQSGSSNPRMRG